MAKTKDAVHKFSSKSENGTLCGLNAKHGRTNRIEQVTCKRCRDRVGHGEKIVKAKVAKALAPSKTKWDGNEITVWAADQRARRVPTFVTKMTRLLTKQQIVKVYGAGAVFKKGHEAPAKAAIKAKVAQAKVKAQVAENAQKAA